jgi:hypothetical protein
LDHAVSVTANVGNEPNSSRCLCLEKFRSRLKVKDEFENWVGSSQFGPDALELIIVSTNHQAGSNVSRLQG